MGNITIANDWEVPDILLRNAYKCVARKVGSYREKFTAEDSNIEMVRSELGAKFAHIRNADFRNWIIIGCKSPDKHGGDWSCTKSGHGSEKYEEIMRERPAWYRDVYLLTDHWKERRLFFLSMYGNKCMLCCSTKKVEVHHNDYDCLYVEDVGDCIPLCRICHKRHHKWMSAIPDEILAIAESRMMF